METPTKYLTTKNEVICFDDSGYVVSELPSNKIQNLMLFVDCKYTLGKSGFDGDTIVRITAGSLPEFSVCNPSKDLYVRFLLSQNKITLFAKSEDVLIQFFLAYVGK